jgi:hypothetical protein
MAFGGLETMRRGTAGVVFQVRLLKKALDETVSYPQNARASRNVFGCVSVFLQEFPSPFLDRKPQKSCVV